MTGLFNIHTVFGSLSPKQSEQEKRAVCFLPVEPLSSSEPEISVCLLLFLTHRWLCHIPDMSLIKRGGPGWCYVRNQTAHFTALKAALTVIFILTLDQV